VRQISQTFGFLVFDDSGMASDSHIGVDSEARKAEYAGNKNEMSS
jgi:hypothetical protein